MAIFGVNSLVFGGGALESPAQVVGIGDLGNQDEAQVVVVWKRYLLSKIAILGWRNPLFAKAFFALWKKQRKPLRKA